MKGGFNGGDLCVAPRLLAHMASSGGPDPEYFERDNLFDRKEIRVAAGFATPAHCDVAIDSRSNPSDLGVA
jgi:hypothetical protein